MTAAILLALLLTKGLVPTEPREECFLSSGSIQDAGLTPQHVVAADFDGDGLLDLAVATVFDDRVSIHRQTSSGSFELHQDVTVGMNTFPSVDSDLPRFLRVADINRDGHPDLMVLCSGDFFYGAWPSVQTLVNRGDGTLAAMPPCGTTPTFATQHFPVHFAVGNFSNDRYIDLVIANTEADSVRILHGDGTGRLTLGPEVAASISGHGPLAVEVLDIDGDAHDDLLVLTSRGLLLIRQEYAGSFAPPVEVLLPSAVTGLRALTLEDSNADGMPEIIVVENTGKLFIIEDLQDDGTSQKVSEVTHASFVGSTDVQSLHWDGDAIPDLLVVNRTANTMSVRLGTGSVEQHGTAMLPRRAISADLNRNGRADLVTVNEGDQIEPGNADLSLAMNAHLSETAWRAEKVSELPIAASLGLRLPRPAGISAAPNGDLWILENNRHAITQTNMSRTIGSRITFTVPIGGFEISDSDGNGWVVQRNQPNLYSLDSDGNLHLVHKFSHDPGPLGYSGLARSQSTGYYYIGSPGTSEIIVLDASGVFLFAFAAIPTMDLAWDPVSLNILAVHGGRSDVRAYSPSGTYQPGPSRELAAQSAFFTETGIAGIAVHPAKGERFTLGTAGFLARWSAAWAVQQSTTVAPLSSVRSIAYDASADRIIAVGDDAQLTWLNPTTGTPTSLAPLWPMLLANPLFVPAGICVNVAAERIYVGSANGPTTSNFSMAGTYLGSSNYAPIMAQPKGRFGGLAISKSTIVSRGTWHTVNTSTGDGVALPQGTARDLSIAGDWLLAPIGNASEMILQSISTGDTVANFTLDHAPRTAGIAFRDGTHFYRLTDGPAGPSLQLWRLRSTSSTGTSWSDYE